MFIRPPFWWVAIDNFCLAIYLKLKWVYYSKFFYLVIWTECWLDGPVWWRIEVKKLADKLIRRFFGTPIYADRSYTLWERFKTKRKNKLGAVITIISEYYVIQIISWRNVVRYWQEREWNMTFFALSIFLILWFKFGFMFVYRCESLYLSHMYDEIKSMNGPRRNKTEKWRRDGDYYWCHNFIRGYYPYRNFDRQSTYSYNFYTLNYNLRPIYQKYNLEFFPTIMWFKEYFIRIYLFITTYFVLGAWIYHYEIYNSLIWLYYSSLDDYIILTDEDDDVTVLTIAEYLWNSIVLWIFTKIIQIDVKDYYTWSIHPRGWFFEFNNRFIENQRKRRNHWLRYKQLLDLTPIEEQKPFIYDRPSDLEVNEYKKKLQEYNDLWWQRVIARRFINRWPLKNLKEWLSKIFQKKT